MFRTFLLYICFYDIINSILTTYGVIMYINELEKGQKITLSVKIGTETVEFETTVQEPVEKKRAITADVVRDKEKIVSFKSSNIFVDLYYYPSDAAPILFKNVKVLLFKDKEDNVCYVIATNSPSSTVNRRESFRIFVGKTVVVQRGLNRAADDAILKDLCNNGFSFTVDENATQYEVNQTIHTVLNDTIEEIGREYSFQLYGIILRRDEIENGRVVYGCKLNSKVPGLETYIMLKERIRLSKKNGN